MAKSHHSQYSTYWPFIAWDGEGTATPIYTKHVALWFDEEGKGYEWNPAEPQPYVLLANSVGGELIRKEGLGTQECFEFILHTKKIHPHSIFVGFGFNYDINQILKDVPLTKLKELHETGSVTILPYKIEWVPSKWLKIVKMGLAEQRSATIYDILGFFQESFLKACEKYLGSDDPDLTLIRAGKQSRSVFNFNEFDNFVRPYCQAELRMTVKLMNRLRDDVHDAGLHPTSQQWYGPGAIANIAMKTYSIRTTREIPKEVERASQYAYAGGRAERFFLGRHPGPVYVYDIHSAYPAAAIQLPDLSAGHWEYVESWEPDSFGVWNIWHDGTRGNERPDKPQPLFCRSASGLICFPTQVQGWYWTPEARCAVDHIRHGWVFRPDTDDRPFEFINNIYEQRRLYKSQGRSAERALKLILNSLYGKLAQTIGGRGIAPHYHQLEWAGYITSHTRAQIYEAILKAKPGTVIGVETDSIITTEPIDLPMSPALGDWDLTEYDTITYLQTGFYYAGAEGEVCKFRGLDRDGEGKHPSGLPYREILDYLCDIPRQKLKGKKLRSISTRYVGLALGLQTASVWRSWEKIGKQLDLDLSPILNKRYHLADECQYCQEDISLGEHLHPCNIGGYSGHSYAKALPWLTSQPDDVDKDIIDWQYIEDMANYQ
jgi:DNA polymerase type B, organellar and viral